MWWSSEVSVLGNQDMTTVTCFGGAPPSHSAESSDNKYKR